jgi:MtaA/CmuA family methyltransferase
MHEKVQGVSCLSEKVGDRLIVEGWIEGPVAEAANLRGINRLMVDFYDDPTFVNELLEFVLELELRYAEAQIEAGADMIGIGDAAASLTGPRFFNEHIWHYEKKMVDAIHAMGAKVRLHICGDTTSILPALGRLGCDIIDLDSPVSISDARTAMGAQQVILGNINPVSVLRNGTPYSVREEITRCHADAGPRYIVGAGCEVPRDTPVENLMALRDYARTNLP